MTTPAGIILTPAPHPRIILPQNRWVQVTPLLSVPSRVRRLKKPRPVRSRGHVLVMVRRPTTVWSSRPLVRTCRVILLDRVVRSVSVWVRAIRANIRDLRVVHFPMALMRPGTRLVCRPSRMLTRV